jgi:NADPH:quinone reductase-like Zn-dependent oxidoreductase
MRAARIHEYGGPAVIRIDEIEPPRPGPGEVLIYVTATSMNPTETAVRAGRFPIDLPLTLGWDVAGTVNGEPVIAMLESGAAAEYAIAPETSLIPAPATIPLADAAALPLAGLTAWQAVFDHARITPGERVLINGAGGGIGTFALQLARHAGAHVIATASPRSRQTVHDLGAHEILDYTAGPLILRDGPADVVLNCAAIGPEEAAALAHLGTRIITVATPIPGGRHFIMRNAPSDLKALVKLTDAGRIRPVITGRRPLADLPDLHRQAEAGALHGKVIVTL